MLGGVATHSVSNSTARQGWDLGYELVIVRDVTSELRGLEPHDRTMRHIFPRISRVTESDASSFSGA